MCSVLEGIFIYFLNEWIAIIGCIIGNLPKSLDRHHGSIPSSSFFTISTFYRIVMVNMVSFSGWTTVIIIDPFIFCFPIWMYICANSKIHIYNDTHKYQPTSVFYCQINTTNSIKERSLSNVALLLVCTRIKNMSFHWSFFP